MAQIRVSFLIDTETLDTMKKYGFSWRECVALGLTRLLEYENIIERAKEKIKEGGL
jgi:hypothetical protein